MSHSLAMALWATTVLFSFSRNLVCNLTTQKERRKRNPQQTSHNPKRGFQISTRAFHPQQGGLATVLLGKHFSRFLPGSTLCCEERASPPACLPASPAGVRAWPEGHEGVEAPPG